MRSRSAVLLALVALATTACTGGSAPSSSDAAAASGATRVDLTIFGASSLTGVLARAKAAYEAAHPGTTLTISTDASSALETKIEQGAPADVFLSADITNPQKLIDRGFASSPAVDFANNKLTVIVPTSDPASIRTPADLAKGGVKIIAAGDAVPITRYANQLVANLARQPGYPANFAAAYLANIVSKEDNVKAAVAKVELGEGDASIVYVTDAKAATKIATVAVPDAANVLATYAGVVVKASSNAAAAQAFLTWVAGPDGQAIMSTFGFLPPS